MDRDLRHLPTILAFLVVLSIITAAMAWRLGGVSAYAFIFTISLSAGRPFRIRRTQRRRRVAQIRIAELRELLGGNSTERGDQVIVS